LLQVPFLLAAEYLAVRRAIHRSSPKVIHAHWIIPQGFVARVATRRIPTVVTTLGGDLYALRSGFARRLKSRVVRSAAAVTVMNDEMRDMVIALGADPTTVSVMPMGFELAAFTASTRRTAPDTVALLFVGRLVEKKGLAVLLTALRDAPPAAAWRLTVVGDGPLRPELERAAEGMPVVFVGQRGRADLATAYADADVAIFPSVRSATGDQDGLPVALLEAMGSACAVIASDLPGLDLAVSDGASGLLVPSGDVRELARAIDRLARDPVERRRLAAGAASRARQFDIATVAENYRDLLLRVARDADPSG
jgi:glycosyltransferase involved in cell wall biosynthesis